MLALASLLLASAMATGAHDTPPESNAGAQLERFFQHVRWPDEQQNRHPRQLCLIGDITESTRHFQQLAAGGQVVAVVALTDPALATDCHVIDLRQATLSEQDNWLTVVRDMPVLSIGLGREFCTRGGHICFQPGGTPAFEINLSTARASGLRISARVLGRDLEAAPP